MSMDTVTAAFQRSLEEYRRESLASISTMSTAGYILSSTIYILAQRAESTPTYGAWRRTRRSRAG